MATPTQVTKNNESKQSLPNDGKNEFPLMLVNIISHVSENFQNHFIDVNSDYNSARNFFISNGGK